MNVQSIKGPHKSPKNINYTVKYKIKNNFNHYLKLTFFKKCIFFF